MNSSITFESDHIQLREGFAWAKAQALHYVHDSGPAGPWYEAALPGRDAFCMRDVSHQAAGAYFLGLAAHNKNMLAQFARGIAKSRDWCSYWEITGNGVPAPVDYTNDQDFWYNLPANFDVMDACWRMYCLTGDGDYLDRPDFVHFYDRTVTDYIAHWDHDGDGIPDRAALRSRRGIPSYDEQKGMEQMAVAADLIAAQYRGFLSYARLRNAPAFYGKAQGLANLLSAKWWDAANSRFYGAMHTDGTMLDSLGSPHLLAYFDAIADPAQKTALLQQIHQIGEKGIAVELLSHYPEIFYRHSDPCRGFQWLLQLTDPKLNRREYPEASFSAIGAYVLGLFGLQADASTGTVHLQPNIPAGTQYMNLIGCPLFDGYVDILCSTASITLENHTSENILWDSTPIAPNCAHTRTAKENIHETI